MLEIVVTSNASIYAISVNDYCFKERVSLFNHYMLSFRPDLWRYDATAR